jgi:NSS family neurotransmitter:Na+ symporter
MTLAWGAGAAGAQQAGDYFFNTVLRLSDSPGTLGGLNWPIVGALAFTWIVIYLVIYRGAEIVGKVSQVVMTLSWILILAILIRSLTLPGAVDGLNYYLDIDWSVLKGPDVWFAAFSQIAFSLSVGMAGMYAYGRFIAKKSDITNNTVITSLCDTSFAFLAGFAVFSTVGYIMQAMGVSLQDVTIAGIGLAFVTYPVGISLMPALNQLTGVLFFLMFWLIGLSSAYYLAYAGYIVPLVDKFGWNRKKVAFWGCLIGFLIGLLYCTQGGLYWLDIVDRTVAFYTLLIGGAIASLVVGWVFGARKLREHVNATSDIKVGPWMDILIKIVVPVGLVFVVIYGGFMQDLKKPYGGYGGWSNFIWIILLVVLIASFVLQRMKSKKEEE